MNKYLKTINVKNETPVKSTVSLGTTSLKDELPDISDYPITVQGNGEINIEIFSSPEKAGNDTDGWLNEVAKSFNNANNQLDGKKVSVSIRSIASGAAVDYIVSGKYIPDAFTPSNELWGDMIKAQNVNLDIVDKRNCK